MTAGLRQSDPAASIALATKLTLLEQSQDFCRRITKRQAKNFYYGLKLLPEPKRSAMCALYAYMRLVDDIADDDSHQKTLQERHADLTHWQTLTHHAFTAAPAWPLVPLSPYPLLWPAFTHLHHIYQIPQKIFDDMIAGQRHDLSPTPIRTFADLHQYCYRVASVVGLASLYVWGFEKSNPDETLQLASDRGIAFQLTNVLRDLHEDSAKNRCYLPEDELAQFQITPEQLGRGDLARNPNFLALMQFQITRARSYYEKSAPLEARISADSRPTLHAMTAIYRGILEKIATHPARVLTRRIRLSTPAKLLIAWRAMRS